MAGASNERPMGGPLGGLSVNAGTGDISDER